MKYRIFSFILAFSLLLCTLSSCGTASGPEAQPARKLTFTDDAGRDVEIPEEITRIVPSGPLAQIVLFALCPEMLVGLANKWTPEAEGIIPTEYQELPYLGQLYGSADLNVESLAAAAPQMIIDIGESGKTVAEDMDTLQAQTSIPGIHIDAALETMPEVYRKLGSILGKEAEAEALAQFCEKILTQTQNVMEQVDDDRATVLYCLGEDGLNVLAKGSYHAELLDMLADNAAILEDPSPKGTGNAVDMEQIALWDPEFIMFAPGSVYADADKDATWSGLRAISSGNYVEIPYGPHNWMGMPPGVQRYLGLIWLPAVLYPDSCDYSVREEVAEFYELFYHCTLTEAQYEALTANAFVS